MDIKIRLETEQDYKETETVTREAFWNVYRPGCIEHLILSRLRKSDAYVKELAVVACLEGKIIGHAMCTKAEVRGLHGEKTEVLCLGPISVLPEYQRKQVGSALVDNLLERAKEFQYSAVFLYGTPDFYHRFGFQPAKQFGVATSGGDNFEAFMALPLKPDGLSGVKGRLYENEAFEVKDKDVEEFDKVFPSKEKHTCRFPGNVSNE